MKLFKKAIAELIGTFVLVVFACGTIGLVQTAFKDSLSGLIAQDAIIALVFGLSFAVMSYSVGNVSGCHINPAISFGVLVYNYLQPKEKRNFSFVDFLVYIIFQVGGAFLGCLVLLLIFGNSMNFGTNLVTKFLVDQSGPYYSTNALGIETLLSAVFVFVFIGLLSKEKFEKCSGLIAGLALTLVTLVGYPLTSAGINPAKSIATAVFAFIYTGNASAIDQLWIFIAGPLLGALIAALIYWFITYEETKKEKVTKEPVKEEISPMVEEKVEETHEEPKVEETKVEPVIEEVNVEPVVEESAKKEKLTIERISFIEKLAKADKDISEKYNLIKREIESYGVKSRLSFEGDTFRLHRIAYVFVTIRGKSLKVYYRLDPQKYAASPIPVKDESHVKKYSEIPAVLKVKSDLSYKRALLLISDVMHDASISRQVINISEDDKK